MVILYIMVNSSIQHIKKYQEENGGSWKEAMKNAKATYKTGTNKVKKKKDAMDKKRLPKEVVELGGEKITIRKGGLPQSLKVPDSDKFKIKELNSLKQVEIGDKFKFRNRIFKMTGKLKKQIVLGINLMK